MDFLKRLSPRTIGIASGINTIATSTSLWISPFPLKLIAHANVRANT